MPDVCLVFYLHHADRLKHVRAFDADGGLRRLRGRGGHGPEPQEPGPRVIPAGAAAAAGRGAGRRRRLPRGPGADRAAAAGGPAAPRPARAGDAGAERHRRRRVGRLAGRRLGAEPRAGRALLPAARPPGRRPGGPVRQAADHGVRHRVPVRQLHRRPRRGGRDENRVVRLRRPLPGRPHRQPGLQARRRGENQGPGSPRRPERRLGHALQRPRVALLPPQGRDVRRLARRQPGDDRRQGLPAVPALVGPGRHARQGRRRVHVRQEARQAAAGARRRVRRARRRRRGRADAGPLASPGRAAGDQRVGAAVRPLAVDGQRDAEQRSAPDAGGRCAA